MTVKDYKITYKYLHQYGKAVVKEIKARIKRDKLIDTGALYRSINYVIIDKNNTLQILFRIGDGEFKYGSGLPSEYGVYQDQGTIYIDPHYFFSAPIPGLSQRTFISGLNKAMKEDVENYIAKEYKAMKRK